MREIRVGDLLADAGMPSLMGVVIDIDFTEKEPYTIFCEGQIVKCDLDYIEEYCKIVSKGEQL